MPSPGPSTYWSLEILPVQAWIAEARRSRDLLAGSVIVSWLMARLLRRLRSETGAERTEDLLLLPALEPADLEPFDGELGAVLRRPRLAYGIPNRAAGRLPCDLERAATALAALEEELAAAWADLRAEVARLAARSTEKLWRLIEPHAAAAPCPFQLVWTAASADGSDLAAVDRLHAGAKRARRIAPHEGGAPVPKCSQCGRRESAGGPDPADWRRFRQRLAELPEVQQGHRVEESEILCPVCLTKRFAGYFAPGSFPSTSEVAAREWLASVRAVEDLRELVQELVDAARRAAGGERPGADWAPLLFRRSIRRELRESSRQGDSPRVQALNQVECAQCRLADAIRSPRSADWDGAIAPGPPDYVAVVVFDGDDMGRRVRQRLEELPAQISRFQRRLGDRLDQPDKIAGGDPLAAAQPFYLGGDEGLLLAPATSALELAHAVRDLWSKATEAEVADAPTLSVGVALFDRERPLGVGIENARHALAEAKSLPGKNGLGVVCSTASGSRWIAVRSWAGGWDWARAAVEELRAGRLSRGWPHDVERFLRALPDEAWYAGDSAAPIREEVKRLTYRRATVSEGSRRASGEAVWRRLGGDDWWPEIPPAEERRAIAEQLHVVAFLNRLTEGATDAA